MEICFYFPIEVNFLVINYCDPSEFKNNSAMCLTFNRELNCAASNNISLLLVLYFFLQCHKNKSVNEDHDVMVFLSLSLHFMTVHDFSVMFRLLALSTFGSVLAAFPREIKKFIIKVIGFLSLFLMLFDHFTLALIASTKSIKKFVKFVKLIKRELCIIKF